MLLTIYAHHLNADQHYIGECENDGYLSLENGHKYFFEARQAKTSVFVNDDQTTVDSTVIGYNGSAPSTFHE